jgi:hypothetical protein
LSTSAVRRRTQRAKVVKAPPGREFHFYLDVGVPANKSASTLKEFKECLKAVDSKSIAFHLNRGDFEKWVSEMLKDEALAATIKGIREQNLPPEESKRELVRAI